MYSGIPFRPPPAPQDECFRAAVTSGGGKCPVHGEASPITLPAQSEKRSHGQKSSEATHMRMHEPVCYWIPSNPENAGREWR